MPLHPVLAKLRVKESGRACVVNAPESYGPVLAEMPPGVQIEDRLDGQFDFVHYFATRQAELEEVGPRLKAALKPGGILWVSYPKGSALPTDLKRDVIWKMLGEKGLTAVAQVAIDDVWSAMRFKHS